ncbi:hypothetical protein ACFWA9_09815 [Kitasatospora sp. NPDC059973]|uniref:hypothetical protein n=1 Tax=Kitasatospora sp. NPDC059973 TaxID=3347020 RepID=UPI0036C23B2D
MSIATEITKRSIAADVSYLGRYARDCRSLSESGRGAPVPILGLCMVPYISLCVHESQKKLGIVMPHPNSELSATASSIVARSRHSLKLFEDSGRGGIHGLLSYFHNEAFPAHFSKFRGKHSLSLARLFGHDLGISYFDGKLISTSCSSTLFLGMPLEISLRQGVEIGAIYKEYGSYLGGLGARLDTGPASYAIGLNPGSFTSRDDRIAIFYSRGFNEDGTLALNAALTVFRGLLNFADRVICHGHSPLALEYAPFKMRYITLYHVLSSLRLLRNDPIFPLSDISKGFLDNILSTNGARTVMSGSGRPFRNSLIHYDLDSRIRPSEIDFDEPLFGLVHACFQLHNFASFSTLVDQCIKETAAQIDTWAECTRK